MKTIAILAVIGVAALAMFSLNSGVDSGVEGQFRDFLSTYRQGYGTDSEYQYRLGVFAANLNTIAELNSANPRATFAVNQFADRTPEEMKQRMGLVVPAGRVTGKKVNGAINAASVDWTNMWDSVKDQGQCGSCWAFSATAAFESRFVLAHGTKHTDELYSEQELVDCEPQSDGCNGGFMDYAFEYLQSQAFCTEDQYPYHARDESCKVSKCAGGPSDKSFTDIPEGDEDALLNELANGPVAVAVDASTWSFYSGGILDSCSANLNHGVTLVAYDSSEGSAKIRNSWGGSWGEKGHIRLAVGGDMCGYADVSSFPTF